MDEGVECARLIRTVQNGERQKLQCTFQLQALRKAHEFNELPCQSSDADSLSPSDFPEDKFQSQIKDNTTKLQEAIQQINDALDEIRCIKNDLQL